MSKMVKCINCDTVYQKKGVNLLFLIILLCLGVVPGVIYLLACKNKCPKCGIKQ